MPNGHIENIALVLALARSIERHHLGCKIPDLIVDRLVGELSSAPRSSLVALTAHFEDPTVVLGQIAYEIWKEGNLNIVSLTDKLLSEVQRNRNPSLYQAPKKLVRHLALPLSEFLHPNLKLAC